MKVSQDMNLLVLATRQTRTHLSNAAYHKLDTALWIDIVDMIRDQSVEGNPIYELHRALRDLYERHK